jgi:hypothetical protein
MKGFSDPVENDYRHKKTTHRFDRRLVESVGVSTADVIRLPNSAGFGIRGDLIHRGWMVDLVVGGATFPVFVEHTERSSVPYSVVPVL